MRSAGILIALALAAACASPPASVSGASAKIAEDVAVAIRELGEAKVRYGDKHPDVVRLKSAQASLLASDAAVDPDFQNDLVEALTHEVAIARRENAELAIRYGDTHPEMRKSAAGIAALTQALGEAAR